MKTDSLNSYYIWTIGCQMNKADSERLSSALDQLGLQPVERAKDADVIVLNSCVVRQSAEDKVASTIGMMQPLKKQRPNCVIALMGCMVGPKHDHLKKRFPYVDIFMQPQQYEPLLDKVGKQLGLDWEGCVGTLAPTMPLVTTYIPIIHGCDLMCSFCIIPYRRGRQKSQPVGEVAKEVELLAARGVKEITLLGQTVDAYGYDLPDSPDLATLFDSLNNIEGIQRIRFLTSHPSFMSNNIIESVAKTDKVCEHINLPIQAGDDDILSQMRRRYSVEEYYRLVENIRTLIPKVSISTDIIVGFCGETEDQFQKTVQVVKDLKFDKIHVAAYSNRLGTIASRKMVDSVPKEEKEHRKKVIENLQGNIQREKNSQLQDTLVEVLVDGQDRGKWRGRTKSDKLVFIEDTNHLMGKMMEVKITRTGPWSLQGKTLVESSNRKGI